MYDAKLLAILDLVRKICTLKPGLSIKYNLLQSCNTKYIGYDLSKSYAFDCGLLCDFVSFYCLDIINQVR